MVDKVFKKNSEVKVFSKKNNPNEVLKKYSTSCDCSLEELREKRKKLIDMKNKENWPSFSIKPTKVGNITLKSFTARFPFVDGIELNKFLLSKDISLTECANILKKIEDKVSSEDDYVFADIATPSNTMIINKEENDIDIMLIDPDDIQFNNYKFQRFPYLIMPHLNTIYNTRGMSKCFEHKKMNKQIEIRSLYYLLYYIINGNVNFYPSFIERDSIEEYELILQNLNIPESSSLYEKSLITVSDQINNKPIGDSLFELIDKGYEFKTYDKDYSGYKHILVKK